MSSTLHISIIVAALTLVFLTFRWYLRILHYRFLFKGIPGPLPESWFKGNLGQLFNHKGLPFHQSLVDRFGGIAKVYGFFGDEQLYISDPRALHSIIIKDQDSFDETDVFLETNKVIFGPGLVATNGEQHKRQRKIVNPVFSVTQLREITPVFHEIANKLVDVITAETTKNSADSGESVLDMSEWMCRVALESVGQTVLGYSFDPLDSPHNNPYTSAINELIPTLFSLSLVRQFAPFLSRLGSPSFRRRLVELTPNRAVQKVKDMSDVMYQTAQGILQAKRDALLHQDGLKSSSRSKDIISVLLRANELSGDDEQLTDSELIGQMTVLIFGAQDTTSSALSRILYMLSKNPLVQQKVREELSAAQETGHQLEYDEIIALPWLDAVMKETLRLYPPVPFVRRTAVKECTVPLSEPVHSSDPSLPSISRVTIPKGTTIFVSIAGPNRLESVWGPDAKEWKPTRWLSADMKTGIDAKASTERLPGIYSGMMSFLGGSRSCIGYKFAQVEMKIILAALITRFTFSLTGDEIVWNLSQIISPSVRKSASVPAIEEKGLPLVVRMLE